MRAAVAFAVFSLLLYQFGGNGENMPASGIWLLSQFGRSVLPESMGVGWMFDRADSYAWSLWEIEFPKKKRKPLEIPKLSVEQLDEMGTLPSEFLLQPFLIPGLLNNTNASKIFGVPRLLASPVGDLKIHYFKDARRFNTVPDGYAPLREIATNITKGGVEKFGTEMIFRTFPQLIDELPVHLINKIVSEGYVSKERLGKMLTIPVFMGHGQETNSTRTDLHCEPIANVVLQLAGSKRWTLIMPHMSKYLKPQIGPDGRAYVYSTRHPSDTDILHLERYEVVMEQGDVMFIPTWTWHRVEYLAGVTALSASFFHVRIKELMQSNSLFASATIPNMLKELFGIKKQ